MNSIEKQRYERLVIREVVSTNAPIYTESEFQDALNQQRQILRSTKDLHEMKLDQLTKTNLELIEANKKLQNRITEMEEERKLNIPENYSLYGEV